MGKSSIMGQFTSKQFQPTVSHTVGVEFGTRVINIGDHCVKLQIWDTAGQERFRSVTRSYYRASAGALLVFDVTRRETFVHLTNWLTDCRNQTNPNAVILLIGNKCDLSEQRQVSFEEAQTFAQENKLLYMETSAKTGQNVEEAFLITSKKIFENIENGTINANTMDSGVSFPVSSIANDVFSTKNVDDNSGFCYC